MESLLNVLESSYICQKYGLFIVYYNNWFLIYLTPVKKPHTHMLVRPWRQLVIWLRASHLIFPSVSPTEKLDDWKEMRQKEQTNGSGLPGSAPTALILYLHENSALGKGSSAGVKF